MKTITDAEDPNLSRFLKDRDGKLIIYHGWSDTLIVAEDTLDYFNDMVNTTFSGSIGDSSENARLFLAPGMAHCGGGPGPNTWDKLPPLVNWVENGAAPVSIIATHSISGTLDNERPICAYPRQATYVGPSGGQNNPDNWIAENFSCR